MNATKSETTYTGLGLKIFSSFKTVSKICVYVNAQIIKKLKNDKSFHFLRQIKEYFKGKDC